MGLIVVDAARKICACHGELVAWLKTERPATEAISVLVGLDDILDQIAAGDLASFSLPRVSWPEAEVAGRVLSLDIVRADEPDLLHLLLRDETEIAILEQEVIQRRNELSLSHDALAKAKERAEDLLQEKVAFLANVSHDLKTPLQVIMGNAELLQDNLPSADRDAFLNDILENSTFLLSLISDLLDASTLEAQQQALTEEPIDVHAMLERVLTMARKIPGCQARQFTLLHDDEAIVLRGDAMRFLRLLLNIVSNAVKFTGEDGQIDIKARRTETGGLVVEVKDDGCGIDPDLLGHVFEPFTRSGQAEGSGLGLHIAKSIAAMHDADLSLVSEPGHGTTATLQLPKDRVMRKRI